MEEMKLALLNMQISKGVNHILQCPSCEYRGVTYERLLEHYSTSSRHSKALEPLWQLVNFGTTFLSKALKNPMEDAANVDEAEVDLAKFTEDLGDGTLPMRLAVKFKKIPMNSTIIQPSACFLLSAQLEPCHECWKVQKGCGNVGSICQFEGFRKVKRIPCDLSAPFGFDANGFLDPFADPSESDKDLWTSPTKPGMTFSEFHD